jgi:peptidyl-prolyl cis-trans isomerase SurA
VSRDSDRHKFAATADHGFPAVKAIEEPDVTTPQARFAEFLGRICLTTFLFAVCLAAAQTPAAAQVVVVVNGSPITALDIEQRSKLMSSGASHKAPSRQEVINDLIEDRLKITYAKRYSFEVSDKEVDEAFETMAKRQHLSARQFEQVLLHAGIEPSALKARTRAEITWSQLVRGRYSSSLQIGEADIKTALEARNISDKDEIGYVYTLYPVTVVVQRSDASNPSIEAKRQTADGLRSRFQNCNMGLAMARALRDVAVGEPVSRSSADLPAPLRELLGNMQIGQMTAPEVTAQGLQMYALCAKKENTTDSTAKHEVREELYNKRFGTEAKKFMEEIRKSAMIEYK